MKHPDNRKRYALRGALTLLLDDVRASTLNDVALGVVLRECREKIQGRELAAIEAATRRVGEQP